ncbi:MAG: hypothetical protein LBK98_05245 [Peptococcaceae bacterium]|jgi:hypothetical protein|nr:hypothetical protein [Peptococcaceae bacterium]
MEKSGIFRQESLERALSPDQLDQYIKVSNPGIWLALLALLILFASVLVWGFTGALPKTITVNGILAADGKVVCFIDASALSEDIKGREARVAWAGNGTRDGIVSDMSLYPYSAREIAAAYESDWVTLKLATSDYAYAVTVDLSDGPAYSAGGIASVTIITEEVKPISYLLN